MILLLAACGSDPCDLRWLPAADPGTPLPVELARFGALSARPIRLWAAEGVRSVPVKISASGDALTLLSEIGAAIDLPLVLPADELPVAFLAQGIALGDTTITATVDSCEPVSLTLQGVPVAPLAGHSREEDPGFGYEDLYTFGQSLEVLPSEPLDADVYVVAHDSWQDNSLIDVTGEVEHLDGADATVAWPAVDPGVGVIGARYDLVLDVDEDGLFSPGDRLDRGPDGEGLRVAGDLAQAGPHTPEQADITGGDWLAERVYWPSDLAALGPRPLVVISHGNGHEYTWYDYLGAHLASWGFVVMAHENETMPGIETASTTTLTNTDWFLANLDILGLDGLVDAENMGWIGHSRGGEGIVRAYARLISGETIPEAYTAEDIRLLASIAPTVFYPVDVSDPGTARYHLMAGSADIDVHGSPAAAEAQSFRLYQRAGATRSSTYIYGAGHEAFDCCGNDVGRGPDQLEREDVQAIAKAYLLAVVAESLDFDPIARGLLERDPADAPATELNTTVLGTWRPENARVLDDFQWGSSLSVASSMAPVTMDVSNPFEDRLDDADAELTWTEADPMNGMTQASDAVDDARGVVFDWGHASSFSWAVPDDLTDWSSDSALSFHACQITRDPITEALGAPLDLSVTLTDGAGMSVTRSTRPYATIPEPYQRGTTGEGRGWSNAFGIVRMPLVDFATATGLDLTDVQFVRLELGAEGDSPYGRIGLDDVLVLP